MKAHKNFPPENGFLHISWGEEKTQEERNRQVERRLIELRGRLHAAVARSHQDLLDVDDLSVFFRKVVNRRGLSKKLSREDFDDIEEYEGIRMGVTSGVATTLGLTESLDYESDTPQKSEEKAALTKLRTILPEGFNELKSFLRELALLTVKDGILAGQFSRREFQERFNLGSFETKRLLTYLRRAGLCKNVGPHQYELVI